MNASSQRVKGYSFLILFCEVDPSLLAESRKGVASSKRVLAAHSPKREQVKETERETQSWHLSFFFFLPSQHQIGRAHV